jgi:isoleucyl-tRNA synthetase
VPIFYCRACGAPLISAEVFRAVEALVRAESADTWFNRPPERILPPGTRCGHCSGTDFRQETDILDVWFDSGVSHAAVLANRPELKFPADLYLEGSDQHRGWFQVSLLTAVATLGQAPYRAVLTHGYAVDGEGRKMSKSLGNFITAEEGIARYGGADILRLWVSSENVQSDVRFSDEIMKRTTDAYRRIRNTLRFLLGNLSGFIPARAVRVKDLPELDRYMLHRLQVLTTESAAACDAYEFHRFFQLLHNFCSTDLSAFYFDILKDSLYADGVASAARLGSQTVLWQILRHMVRLISPILVHTAEETWEFMSRQGLQDAPPQENSVHLAAWPTAPNEWNDPELGQQWERLLLLRQDIQKQLEEARNQKVIGHSYEAAVVIRARGEQRSFLAAHVSALAPCFVVSEVRLEDAGSAGPDLQFSVQRADGTKCSRCWRVLTSVGKHADQPELCARCYDVVSARAGKE